MNTGLICSCTLAFKPFLRYFVSNRYFRKAFGGLTSHPKNSVPYGKRSDIGPLARQNTEGMGFRILGDGTEMDLPRTRAVEVVHDV